MLRKPPSLSCWCAITILNLRQEVWLGKIKHTIKMIEAVQEKTNCQEVAWWQFCVCSGITIIFGKETPKASLLGLFLVNQHGIPIANQIRLLNKLWPFLFPNQNQFRIENLEKEFWNYHENFEEAPPWVSMSTMTKSRTMKLFSFCFGD